MTDAKDTRFTSQTPPPSKRSQRAAIEPWEDAVRRAFDDVNAPQDLCQATLSAIEERRIQMQHEDSAVAKAVAQVPADALRTDEPSAAEPSAVVSRMDMPRAERPRTDAPPAAEPPSAALRKRRFKAVKRIVAAAACVLVVAAGIVGYRAYFSPAAFVGLDVNPSVELAVNEWGVVIDAQALNKDGEELLSDVTLQNKSYEDALDAFLASEGIAALGNDTYIEVSVTTDDETLADRIQQSSNQCLSTSSCEGSCHRVDEETRESAHHAGMGVGKYAAAQLLAELDPTITVEDCEHMSMRELRDRIDACKGESSEQQGESQSQQAGQSQSTGEHVGNGGMHHGHGEKGHRNQG